MALATVNISTSGKTIWCMSSRPERLKLEKELKEGAPAYRRHGILGFVHHAAEGHDNLGNEDQDNDYGRVHGNAKPAEWAGNRPSPGAEQGHPVREGGRVLAGLAGRTAHLDGVVEHAHAAVSQLAAGLIDKFMPGEPWLDAGGKPGVQVFHRDFSRH